MNYFLHNEGKTVAPEDIEKAYGFSTYYQEHNLLKHLETLDIISKTSKGYKLKKSSDGTKALKKFREYIEDERRKI
jgi:hypothetical protein